ncbi:hypothetical protein DPV78_006258 [Talaromyces pinophilus]|nr:hypothetical protein DPV78_006258 [Talaromyces pinophilus]
MAEVIAVAGGIASATQVLAYLARVTTHTVSFYNSFTEAPRVLGQIEEKLHILKQIIGQVQSYTTECDDNDLLPTETKELLLQTVKRVQYSLNKAKSKCQVVASGNIKKKMKRVAWVLRDEPALNKLLQDLYDSDHILHMVMQLLTMKMNLLALKYQSAAILCGNKTGKSDQRPVAGVMSKSQYMVYSWPWLRRLGLYGTFKSRSYSQCLLDADIYLGYQFPTWLWSKSIDFQLQIRIPSFIRMQNRVSAESPFMVACRQGDIDRMRQHLADKSGSVADRLSCTGQTPLMLSIESENIDAIKVLLDAGANPNLGDDDGITPIFFALGMNPRKNKPFPQLPPMNAIWIDIIRLLAEHGASVHDVVHGRSLTTLNIFWHHGENRILEFFHFLQDQCYVDFGAEKVGAWSAFTNALRSPGTSLECLKFLEARGVDFSKISTDGRSLLHFGAELAHEPEVIEYLCKACPSHYVNRQDDFGWTPLHYAIVFEALHMPQESLAKVQVLVRRGANPSITARRFPLLHVVDMDKDRFTAYELSEALKSDQYEKFLAIARDNGLEIPEEAEGNIFQEIVDSGQNE